MTVVGRRPFSFRSQTKIFEILNTKHVITIIMKIAQLQALDVPIFIIIILRSQLDPLAGINLALAWRVTVPTTQHACEGNRFLTCALTKCTFFHHHRRDCHSGICVCGSAPHYRGWAGGSRLCQSGTREFFNWTSPLDNVHFSIGEQT